MGDQEDDSDAPSQPTGFAPLFIEEEDGQRAVLETHLNGYVQIQPHLREMDELLRSCEGLTGLSLESHLSDEPPDPRLGGLGPHRPRPLGQREAAGDRRGGNAGVSARPHQSPSYMAMHMDDGPRTQNHTQVSGSSPEGQGVTPEPSSQPLPPLTSAGTELSGSMNEYQSQLLGMLAMLESCMEEAGIDFDPQEWDMDANANHYGLGKGASLGQMENAGASTLDNKSTAAKPWLGLEADWVSQRPEEANRAVMSESSTLTSHVPWASQEDILGQGWEQADKTGVCVDFKVDLGTLDAQIAHLQELGNYEGMPTRGQTQETNVDIEPVPEGVTHSDGMEVEPGELGSRLEGCIEEVERLQSRREQLLEEVLELRREKGVGGEAESSTEQGVAELMGALVREADGRREERLRAVQTLWGEKREEERRMWKARLERQGLQEEARRLKRRLFAVAKECAHSQISLTTQQLEVEQLHKEQEQLQSMEAQLTEEGTQLRSTHQQRLASMQAHLQAQSSSQTSTSTQEELTQCRRHSCGDIQQYLQSSVKAIEQRYEPILLALLKRREATAEGLVKAREQAQEQRVQLGPLREESQRLALQRACLEEKLRLKDSQRREDVAQYKETVFSLEEESRELKTELQIQKRSTVEMEEQKDTLAKQLNLYRGLTEKNNKCDYIEETT